MTVPVARQKGQQILDRGAGFQLAPIYCLWFLFFSLLLLLAVDPAQAQNVRPAPLRDVGIDQRLNEQLPLDLTFRDETGRTVRLGEYFGRKPVILSLVYYDCPMLCTLVLNGLLRSLRALSLDAGDQFNVVTVSFDPRETAALAAAKKATYVKRYARARASQGWHFLTGEEASIQQLTRAAGFRYVYDSQSGQFAHATGIMVLTPAGRLARYFFGIEYSARDLRLALVEASAHKIGSPIDQLLLFCYQYDPTTGQYSLAIMNILRIAGMATLVALGSFVFVMLRRDRRKTWKREETDLA